MTLEVVHPISYSATPIWPNPIVLFSISSYQQKSNLERTDEKTLFQPVVDIEEEENTCNTK